MHGKLIKFSIYIEEKRGVLNDAGHHGYDEMR